MDYDELERLNAEEFTQAAKRLYEAALAEARETYPIGSTNLVIRRAKATLRTACDMIHRGSLKEDYKP